MKISCFQNTVTTEHIICGQVADNRSLKEAKTVREILL